MTCGICSEILKSLQSDALGIIMRLTQSYDNAATLARIYGGAQTIMYL